MVKDREWGTSTLIPCHKKCLSFLYFYIEHEQGRLIEWGTAAAAAAAVSGPAKDDSRTAAAAASRG